ncbi:hypothetical protein OAF17_01810 [Akkermansiaceae bacterium]|nr:hypothetical protein [Akkermansiaceae bacterium]
MPKKEVYKKFCVDGSKNFELKDFATNIDPLYVDKIDYKEQLREITKQIDIRQQMMYAHDRYSTLLVFQAMDAAGKDGTIRRVVSGVDPHGVSVHSYKKPSEGQGRPVAHHPPRTINDARDAVCRGRLS